MPGGYGSNAYVAIARQNSLGSTAPGSWYSMPFINHGINWAPEELNDENITGNIDEPNRNLGFIRAGGPLSANILSVPVGFLFKGLFGAASESAVGSGFNHFFVPRSGDFDPGRATLPFYAFQVFQGESGVSSAFLYQDAFINTLELAFEAGRYVRGDFGILGKDATLMTKAAAPSWPSDNNPFRWSQVSLQIGGAGIVRYRDFRFGFDNRIAGQDRINATNVAASHLRDGFRYFGRFQGTMDIAQSDWLNMRDETTLPLECHIAGVTSISSGVNEFLKIEMPQFKIVEYDTGVAGPGVLTVAIAGRAEYHTGSGRSVSIWLCNTLANGVY